MAETWKIYRLRLRQNFRFQISSINPSWFTRAVYWVSRPSLIFFTFYYNYLTNFTYPTAHKKDPLFNANPNWARPTFSSKSNTAKLGPNSTFNPNAKRVCSARVLCNVYWPSQLYTLFQNQLYNFPCSNSSNHPFVSDHFYVVFLSLSLYLRSILLVDFNLWFS